MLISQALEGKYYRSRSYARKGLDGIIQYAELRKNVYTPDGVYAFLCKVRPEYRAGQIRKDDFYATVYVEIDGE